MCRTCKSKCSVSLSTLIVRYILQFMIEYDLYSLDKPISRNGSMRMKVVGLRETVQLHCDVCANPLPFKYEWKVNSGDLRDGIVGADSHTLTITDVVKEDFAIYTCSVSNKINGNILNSDLMIELVHCSK